MFLFLFSEHNLITIVIVLVIILLIFLSVLKQSLDTMHMLQLNSYNIDQYLIWLRKNGKKFLLNKIIFFGAIALVLLFGIGAWNILGFAILLYIIISLFFIIKNFVDIIRRKKARKPLSYTARIIRNIICNVVLYLFPIIFFGIFLTIIYIEGMASLGVGSEGVMNQLGLFLFLSFTSILILPLYAALAPMITFLSFLIMLPIENCIRKGYGKRANARLKKECKARAIGITGSFGKTSVKNFLYKMLQGKYNVCASPASFNTPMGACRTINENLKTYDDILIQEMGARRVGDIKEVCDIVEPMDAIITEVGEMHLDTFKSIENVLKTKMELVEAVVSNWKKTGECAGDCVGGSGVIVLNGDNELIRKYVSESAWARDAEIMQHIYFVGENKNNDFIIENISGGKDGASFDLSFNTGDGSGAKNLELGEKFSAGPVPSVKTKLIGKNNIIDIALAASFALLKGIDIDSIKYEVRKLEQVKARLEIINVDENTIIINDGYNSNPVGAKNAIDALTTFDGYKKIIVTPGMVELGSKQYEENKKMAEYACDKLDEVVVVGNANKKALMDGAGESVKFFVSEEEAINYARQQGTKKVILLENDIPDNY